MAVNLAVPSEVHPIAGLTLAAVPAGVKYPDRDDLVLLALADTTSAAAVFTKSSFQAAPVVVARDHLGRARPRALLINSGNANAATAQPGIDDALATTAAVAAALGCAQDQVLPFSTGVIGERLPVARMVAQVPELAGALAADGWLAAARGIMTTDTLPKLASRKVPVADQVTAITGMSKGSGMIRPDMATMLAFVATDAYVAPDLLQELVRELADLSFNRVTVDGDTSTNDSFVLMATGASGARIESRAAAGFAEFYAALLDVCQALAQAIIRDGEGATRFVTVRVQGGRTAAECRKVAYTIAESPLVKTAMFAGDANWGRFCMAIGRAGVADLDVDQVDLFLDDVQVAAGGLIDAEYTEERGAAVMAQPEYTVLVDLGRGSAS